MVSLASLRRVTSSRTSGSPCTTAILTLALTLAPAPNPNPTLTLTLAPTLTLTLARYDGEPLPGGKQEASRLEQQTHVAYRDGFYVNGLPLAKAYREAADSVSGRGGTLAPILAPSLSLGLRLSLRLTLTLTRTRTRTLTLTPTLTLTLYIRTCDATNSSYGTLLSPTCRTYIYICIPSYSTLLSPTCRTCNHQHPGCNPTHPGCNRPHAGCNRMCPCRTLPSCCNSCRLRHARANLRSSPWPGSGSGSGLGLAGLGWRGAAFSPP